MDDPTEQQLEDFDAAPAPAEEEAAEGETAPAEATEGAAAAGGSDAAGGGDESTAIRPVFLGNLNPSYTYDDVVNIFHKPVVPEGKEDESFKPVAVERLDQKRGYCFVFLKDAETPDDKDNAEKFVDAISGMKVPGVSESLRAEFARGDGRMKKKEEDRKRNIQPSETLFVVNFNEETTKREDLKMLFEPYGNLVRIDMKRNYAFIQFSSIEEATRAKEVTDGGKLESNVLTVEFVANKQRPGQRGGGRGGGRRDDSYRRDDRGGGYRGGRNNSDRYDRPAPDRNDRYDDRRYDDRGYDDRRRGDDRYDDRGGRGGGYRGRSPSPARGYRGRSRSRSPPSRGGRRSPSPRRGGYDDRDRYDDRRGGYDDRDRYDDRRGGYDDRGRGYDDRGRGYDDRGRY